MQIIIGGITYKVEEVDGLFSHDENGKRFDMNGGYYQQESVIRLDKNQSDQHKIAVMWHEAIHGVLCHAGHTDHDENMIVALGYGIAQLVKDNPDLVDLTTGRAVLPSSDE